MLKTLGFSVVVIVVFALQAVCAAPLRVITPKPESAADTRYEYAEMILQHLLKITADQYGPAVHAHAAEAVSRDRALVELVKGELHITAETPKDDWAQALIPIYVPINKGITGYRIYFIAAQSQAQFARINSLAELKQIKTGSGSQWSTTPILKDAGFKIISTRKLEGLFWMLMGERFQALPRGINEAPQELLHYQTLFPDIRIEQTLAVYIPLPTFFYVSPKHPELAERVTTGLAMMYADGSFDEIFYNYHLAMIESAKLTERKIFTLENPTLAPAVPLAEAKYWYKPGDELSYLQNKTRLSASGSSQ